MKLGLRGPASCVRRGRRRERVLAIGAAVLLAVPAHERLELLGASDCRRHD
jgi:hypothetical protein